MYKLALFVALHILSIDRLLADEKLANHNDLAEGISMSYSEDYQTEESGISITEFFLEDVTFCIPNGAAEIAEITRDGVVEDISNFEITWFYYDNFIISNGPRIDFLNPGQYFVSARHIETGMESGKVVFYIQSDIIYPIVTLSHRSNTSCDPLNGTGEIFVFPFNDSEYGFTWFEGPTNDPLKKLSANTALIEQLPGGTYTVEVLDFITGCSTLRSIVVENNISLPEMTIEFENSTSCNGNGALNVTAITEFGSSKELSDYDFDLYNSDFKPIWNGGPLFTQLSAGTYYVAATNIINQCKSNLIKTDIANDFESSVPSTNFTVIGPNPDFSRCESGPMTLEAQGGEYFRWYDARQEGGRLHEGKTYTIENLQKSTSIWVSGYDPACDLESDRKEVSLKVISLPLITSLKADLEQAKITAEANGLIKWYLNDAELEGQNEQTIVAQTDGIYSVEVTNGDCNETKAISFNGLAFSKPENIVKAPFIPNSTYQWSLDDQLIAHETSSTLNVYENGVYSVKIAFLEESEEVTKTYTLNYSIEITDFETITGLPDSFENQGIKIYPIPFDHTITISFERSVQESVAVRLWDIKGITIIEKKLTVKGDKIILDIPELEKGIYFLEATYSQGSL